VRSMRNVKIPTLTRLASSEDGVENWHSDDGDGEAEDTLPSYHFDWLYCVFGHDEFFNDELCCSKQLSECNEEHSDDYS